jgi:hypothetical protein
LAVKAGIARCARRGQHHGGPRRYGYRVEEGQLVVVSDEARIVRRIFAERAAGLGQRQITRRLSADGIPAPRGGLWRRCTVRGILGSPLYVGRIEHNGRVLEGVHEPIVDEDTWLAVRLITSSSALIDGRPSTEPFVLRGLLCCGRCGHAMVTRCYPNRRWSVYAVYRCLGRSEGGLRNSARSRPSAAT